MNKKTLGFLLVMGITSLGFAQNVVSSYSQYGALSASASASDYRWTRGGSPRSGFYWYWREYTDQALSASGPINLNVRTAPASVVGSFYQPNYPAKALGWATFTNSPTVAVFKSEVSASDDFELNLGGHQAATAAARATEAFTFTITSPSLVSVTLAGGGGSLQLIDDAANEAIFGADGTGTFSDTIDPGTYTIKMSVYVSSQMNTQTGVSFGLGLNSAVANGLVVIKPG